MHARRVLGAAVSVGHAGLEELLAVQGLCVSEGQPGADYSDLRLPGTTGMGWRPCLLCGHLFSSKDNPPGCVAPTCRTYVLSHHCAPGPGPLEDVRPLNTAGDSPLIPGTFKVGLLVSILKAEEAEAPGG